MKAFVVVGVCVRLCVRKKWKICWNFSLQRSEKKLRKKKRQSSGTGSDFQQAYKGFSGKGSKQVGFRILLEQKETIEGTRYAHSFENF